MKTIETTELAVSTTNGRTLSLVNLDQGTIPDMDKAKALPFDLMSDYWTPAAAGESRKLIFDSVKNRQVIDQQSGETIDLPCAYFYEKINGEVKTISNGSKRLIGVIEAYQMQRGTPLLITYLGKKKNATNQYQSDNWSVKPLMLEINSK